MMRMVQMLLMVAPAFLVMQAQAQDTKSIDGTWQGPWYRGMSSGVAKLQIAGQSGTLQLTNAESFGEDARPLVKLEVNADRVSLRADGSAGAPLTLELKLSEPGDKMKG